MFQIGDVVVHPSYGPGKVKDIEKLMCLGMNKRYYEIELLSDPDTLVWVSVPDAKQVGVRYPVSESKLRQIWRVLSTKPELLPKDYKERYELVKHKFYSRDVLQIAEALRDLAWRRSRKGHLTQRGQRLYEKAIKWLASEMAVIQDKAPSATQAQISQRLNASFASLEEEL
jgi:RNA polymerase-interacting CarD/CdnL/TRCF family regulator